MLFNARLKRSFAVRSPPTYQPEQIVESYPSSSRKDTFAAVAYAAELARERIIELCAVGE
jgi:hypothetical protein